MRVLITRAEPDASSMAALCRSYNLTPVMAPVMEIDIEKAPVDLDGIAAFAFTSANGVRAFAANSDIRDLPVYAVGAVTAATAKAEGCKYVVAAGGDVESLCDCIAAESAKIAGCVLHIAGEDRSGDLVRLLHGRGVKAKRQTLYKARALDALPEAVIAMLRSEPPDWASFLSPRTAKLFVELVAAAGLSDRLSKMGAACFSNVVAEAAGDGWREIRVSPERSVQSLFAMIAYGDDPRA